MFLDGSLVFDPTGTAVTTTNQVSTNVLDIVNNRDIGPGMHRMHLMTLVTAAFTSGTATATMNIQLQGAPDNGSGSPGVYNLIGESGNVSLGQLVAGSKAAQFPFPTIADAVLGSITQLGTWSGGPTTTVTLGSGTGTLDGQFIIGAGINPGTTIASGATTTTLTISSNTLTAAGTNVLLTFTEAEPAYRFLRINYVVSNTMTGGTLFSFLVLDPDEAYYYRPGIAITN